METNMSDKTILIVDDAPENIAILSGLLVDFKKKVATSGAKALEIAKQNSHPDLILLDIEMPEMNGFEVCKQLKKDSRTKKIPVIFLTSNMDKKITVEGFQLGASDFLNKPFDADELMMRIKTQLELADAREQLETVVQQMEISSGMLKNSSEEIRRQKKELESERNKSEALLLNVLPPVVAQELKLKGSVTPLHIPIVSVLFADLAGFTVLSNGLSPAELVGELSYLFVELDAIIERNNMEKIKTMGDGYMAAGGVPTPNGSNPVDAVNAGLEMLQFINHAKEENKKAGKPPWELRIGIHTGPVIAGVIGKSKFTYDIWGSTVNIAARLEAAGEPGKVNISGITYQLVKDKFKCSARGKIEVKNMGKIDMYFVEHEVGSGAAAQAKLMFNS